AEGRADGPMQQPGPARDDGPAGENAAAWRTWMRRRVREHMQFGRQRENALSAAWGEAENIWHARHHGEQGIQLPAPIPTRRTSYGPNQIALLTCGLIAVVVGMKNGIPFEGLRTAALEGVASGLGAIFILLAVGALIGTWAMSGTIVAMVAGGGA